MVIKDWQRGYELDYLKRIETTFTEFNSSLLSPFAKVGKNTLAEALHNKEVVSLDSDINPVYIISSQARTAGSINLYYDISIARRQRGDFTISALAGEPATIARVLEKFVGDYFVVLPADYAKKYEKTLVACEFKRIGSKINSFSDIFFVYYRGKPRDFPKLDPLEYQTIRPLDLAIPTPLVQDIYDKLQSFLGQGSVFANHYSNYNKNNAWSAISLRGYAVDPNFILKPEEMSKKWKEENKDKTFALQDTLLMSYFAPEVAEIIKLIPNNGIHRVRLMRLQPGGGELLRHTDQVDPDVGILDNKLMRIHIPIETNAGVEFSGWDCNNHRDIIHMWVGEAWYLDTRKPHTAINNGDSIRTHLVIDFQANESLRRLVKLKG